MRIYMEAVMKASLVYLIAMLIVLMSIDAWQYENFGDCEGCMILDTWYEWRDGDVIE